MVGVLFGLSLIIFTLSRGFPSKYPPWVQYLSQLSSNPTAAQIEQIKSAHGFNLPLYQQYFYWLKDIFSGNLGLSHWAGDIPTFSIFADRFPLTIELAVTAILITFAIGLPLGIFSATRPGKLPDHIVTAQARQADVDESHLRPEGFRLSQACRPVLRLTNA